jgi:hypothetical protein
MKLIDQKTGRDFEKVQFSGQDSNRGEKPVKFLKWGREPDYFYQAFYSTLLVLTGLWIGRYTATPMMVLILCYFAGLVGGYLLNTLIGGVVRYVTYKRENK